MEKKKFEVQAVTHRHDLIYFTWADIGGVYRVYRDEELLYEGTVSVFRDGDFKHAKMYRYSIERLVNGEVVDVIVLQTTAFAQQRNVENPLQFLVMTTIVAKTQIALSWEEINGVTDYEVYRNDIFVKEVQANQYIDRDFSLDESYTYRIQSKRPLAKSEERLSKGKSVLATVFGVVHRASSKSKPAIERFTVSKLIAKPRGLLTPVMQRRRQQTVDDWQFRYTTFLRESLIKNPNVLSKNRFFQGDGRDFDPAGDSYRTRVDVGLDYVTSGAVMRCEKKIGRTIAYDHFGRMREKGAAPDDGIMLERSDHKKGESGFLLTHAVQNPLVKKAPAIDYEVRAVLRRDGTFDMTGYHDQAPHHEIYLIRGEEPAWTPIHLAESEGLAWMSEIIGWHYWRFSNLE